MINAKHLLKVERGGKISNPKATLIIAIVVALVAVCFGLSDPPRLYAVPSQMSHEMSGTVQRIDRQTLTIMVAGESKPTAFAWNTKETKFVRNGAFTSVEALRAGTHVTIHCSHPIFGPMPVLYRVAWQTGVSQKK